LSDPSLSEEIQKIENDIYEKFQVSEEQFRHTVDVTFANDQDIQKA